MCVEDVIVDVGIGVYFSYYIGWIYLWMCIYILGLLLVYIFYVSCDYIFFSYGFIGFVICIRCKLLFNILYEVFGFEDYFDFGDSY